LEQRGREQRFGVQTNLGLRHLSKVALLHGFGKHRHVDGGLDWSGKVARFEDLFVL
jgi:hypothetical protein